MTNLTHVEISSDQRYKEIEYMSIGGEIENPYVLNRSCNYKYCSNTPSKNSVIRSCNPASATLKAPVLLRVSQSYASGKNQIVRLTESTYARRKNI